MFKLKKEQNEHSKKRRHLLWLLLLILLILGAYFSWYKLMHPAPQITSGLPQVSTEKMTDEQLKKYADAQVDQSNVTIQVYPKVEINSTSKTAKMFAQNLPINKNGQTITLKDKKTKEILFESNLLKPGFQVSSATITKHLPKGTHQGIITVTFYDLKEKKQIGQTNVTVTIIVI
jgi:transcriptional regulator of acetoin/glycerol metabolism